MQAGWLTAIFLLVSIAIMSYYTLWQVSRCGHIVRHLHHDMVNPTYPEICLVAFGRVGQWLAYAGILFSVLGAVGAYFVFIGTTLSSLLCPLASGLTPTVMTLIALPVIVLLSWLRSYRFLAPTSVFGVAALFLALILVIVDGAQTHRIQPISEYPLMSPSTIPFFLGNAAFVYLIHVVVLPIEQGMEHRKSFPWAAGWSTGLVTGFNIVFAMLAYFLYAEDTHGNIIENLEPGPLDVVVKVALVIDLVATSALFLLPMFELFENVLFKAANKGQWRTEVLRNCFRTAIVAASCGIAILLPCFSIVTGLSGGFGNTFIGLIMPPLLFLRLSYMHGRWRRLTWKKRWEIAVGVFIATCGLGVFFLSTSFIIIDVITNGCGGNQTLYCALRGLEPVLNTTATLISV